MRKWNGEEEGERGGGILPLSREIDIVCEISFKQMCTMVSKQRQKTCSHYFYLIPSLLVVNTL